jgi:UDP-2,3-diacylglucosamine pyrophosphatase LpxH
MLHFGTKKLDSRCQLKKILVSGYTRARLTRFGIHQAIKGQKISIKPGDLLLSDLRDYEGFRYRRRQSTGTSCRPRARRPRRPR